MLFTVPLNTADNSWQLTAATLVGLMSVPGLVVLYGGVMQKRWSVNSMMLTFITFALVLVVWVLYGFDMGFGNPWHGVSNSGFLGNFIGQPGAVLNHARSRGSGTSRSSARSTSRSPRSSTSSSSSRRSRRS